MSRRSDRTRPHPRHRRVAAALAAALLLAGGGLPAGEIYRYQDAYGNWHFTDDPPAGVGADVVPGISTRIAPPAPASPAAAAAPAGDPTAVDLAGQLEATFDPISPVARATLAVVAVKGATGGGSGFFCSPDGHLLTNRRVVRPAGSGALDEQERTLTGQEGELAALEAETETGRQRLAAMDKDLAGYARVLEKAGDEASRDWARQNHDRLAELRREAGAEVEQAERRLIEIRNALRKSRRDLDWTRTSEAVQRVFDLVLKDGTEVKAQLLETSEVHDLALLKIDGYRTPFLAVEGDAPLSQGMRVFAIGSAQGVQSTMTSGIVTQVGREAIVTDAEVLPGSGGGPLITAEGVVVGITVADPEGSTASFAGASSRAIPATVVRHAFPAVFR